MKKSIILALSLLSLNAMASEYSVVETDQCKYRAEVAVLMKAQEQLRNTYEEVGVMSKPKSVIKGNTVFHFILISSSVSRHTIMKTVALDIKSCKIKSIN